MVHVAGTPCVAFSPVGANEGEQSVSYGHFLIWAGVRLTIQEPVLVQENVAAFPREQLVRLLPMYEFTMAILNPIQFGWPVRRDRQYIVSDPQLLHGEALIEQVTLELLPEGLSCEIPLIL